MNWNKVNSLYFLHAVSWCKCCFYFKRSKPRYYSVMGWSNRLQNPNDVWYGTPTHYSKLRYFCCPTYLYINEGKFEPRAKKGIFIGYASGVKGFMLWCTNPKSPTFVISWDVVFDEKVKLSSKRNSDISRQEGGIVSWNFIKDAKQHSRSCCSLQAWL